MSIPGENADWCNKVERLLAETAAGEIEEDLTDLANGLTPAEVAAKGEAEADELEAKSLFDRLSDEDRQKRLNAIRDHLRQMPEALFDDSKILYYDPDEWEQ